MRPPRPEDLWVERAVQVIPAFVAQRGGAVIWPEVVASLSEGTWIDTNLPTAGFRRLDPHILGRARTELLENGALIEDKKVLNGREVAVYLDGEGLAARRTTAIRAAATARRRLYRTYLGWTTTPDLCGHAAERVVDATLTSLAGTHLWLPPGQQHGQVRRLVDRPVQGGPLDFAGFIPFQPSNPPAGMAPFAVEVKNLRGWLYPWSHEVWDLLAKLGDFPDVVPILVARRIHLTTFRMFKDVGALGFEAREQWFARRGGGSSIDPRAFKKVTQTFDFSDAVLLGADPGPLPRLSAFLATKVHQTPTGRDRSLIEDSLGRWAKVASFAKDFVDLREVNLDGDERRELLGEFAALVADAGLMNVAGWARLPAEYDEDHDRWEPDYDH